MRVLAAVGMVFALCLMGSTAWAQRISEKDVPAELRPWMDWVRDEPRDEGCRVVGDETVCVWPGTLALDVTRTGGSFRQKTVANYEETLNLPGDAEHWPQDVKIGTEVAVVFDQDGRPAVKVPAGSHEVTGSFLWKHLPDTLTIPQRAAILRLSVSGKPVKFPERSGGTLRIEAPPDEAEERAGTGEGQADEPAPERVSLQVFRHVADGVPLKITTHLRLRVSGRDREVSLGRVLLAGSEALRLESPLPLHLKESGELVAQVRAGTHDVRIVARIAKPPKELVAPKRPDPWPDHEIWVWSPNTAHRQVELGGAPPTDPTRTDLPAEWQTLTAFRLEPDEKLTFETVRRGIPEPPPNTLHLERELWLDLDGKGWSVRDRLTGQMHRGWRLDLTAGTLGSAQVDGAPQLITKRAEATGSGIELRSERVDVLADWRTDADTSLPAAGWSERLESVSAELHLPAGWELLHATGVDDRSRTWIDGWDLVDGLVVVALAAAFAKVTSPAWALAATAMLVLTHDRGDAPRLGWLALLGALALARALPAGRARRAARGLFWAATAVLGLAGLEYGVKDLRAAFYPQTDLARSGQRPEPSHALGGEMEPPMPAAVPMVEAEEAAAREGGTGTRAKGEDGAMGRASRTSNKRYAVQGPKDDSDRVSSRRQALDEAKQYGMLGLLRGGGAGAPDAPAAPFGKSPPKPDPSTVVQTGEGTPSWRFRDWRLSWSSAVKEGQTVNLWLLSPTMGRLLSVLRVALLAAVIVGLLRAFRRVPPEPSAGIGGGSTASGRAAAAALLCALAGLLPAAPAAAEVPPREALDELKSRLERDPVLAPQPDCHPSCVSVSRLAGRVRERTLSLEVEVHAAGPGTYTLPGPASTWVPTKVEIDGKATSALALLGDGALHVRVDEGRHELRVEGPIAGSELSLSLGTAPKQVTFDAKGWRVDGIDDNQQAESLQLSRTGAAADTVEHQAGDDESDQGPSTLQSLPTWLQVRRVLSFGVSWTASTVVERVSPGSAPVVARIPLLPGEKVTEAGVVVEGREVVVSLGAVAEDGSPAARGGSATTHWSSVLTESPKLALAAPADAPWTETWVIGCSPIWRCTPEGLSPIAHDSELRWSPVYEPWPGDILTIALDKPGAAPGGSVTIDSASLVVTPGPRQTKSSLALTIRSSSIGGQTLTLPEGVEIERATLGGTTLPLKKGQTRLDVALQPGVHTLGVDFRSDDPIGLVTRAPEVKLGRSAVDARVTVLLPDERWPVAFGGAGSGPAIMIWGWMLVLLGGAVVLSRLPGSPLPLWQWVLLALGLSQADPAGLLVVAGWFFLVAWRRRMKVTLAWKRNLVQIALVGATLLFIAVVATATMETLTRYPDLELRQSALYRPYGSMERGHLGWYVDRVAADMPTPWVLSAPLWSWKGAHLGWVLWLGLGAVGRARWAWESFSEGGIWSPMSLRLGGKWRGAAKAPIGDESAAAVRAPEGEPPTPREEAAARDEPDASSREP